MEGMILYNFILMVIVIRFSCIKQNILLSKIKGDIVVKMKIF